MGKITFDPTYFVRNDRPAVAAQDQRDRRRRIGELLSLWRIWRGRVRERRTLDGMDDRMLADIGRTRGDIVEEISRPFWRG